MHVHMSNVSKCAIELGKVTRNFYSIAHSEKVVFEASYGGGGVIQGALETSRIGLSNALSIKAISTILAALVR